MGTDTTCLLPDWPELPANVAALCTVRRGGVSRAPYDDGQGGGGLNLGTHVGDCATAVARNRACLQQAAGVSGAWLSQVHGSVVVDAAATSSSSCPQADASVIAQAGLACAILTADCLPILLADRQGQVVGAAHAGWRGLAGGIVHATVAAMRQRGARDISAWLGPAIGPACFEVGPEVRAAFVQHHAAAEAAFIAHPAQPGKYLADLYQLARLALVREGIEVVRGGGRCTVSERGSFYSYRRDGVTGRMASLIWIK